MLSEFGMRQEQEEAALQSVTRVDAFLSIGDFHKHLVLFKRFMTMNTMMIFSTSDDYHSVSRMFTSPYCKSYIE
jgi:hypothetical protein